MFTEQPAPPHPIAEVQIQSANAAASQPAPAPVASPEVVTPASAPAAPAANSSVVVDTIPSQPAPALVLPQATQSPTTITSQAERQKEIEQTLLELTSKQRAKEKEQQEQQAAADAAKYAESGDLEEAQKVINNPALPANVRAALLKQLQAKQAKKGKGPLITKKAPLASIKPGKEPAGLAGTGYSANARDYSAAPIVPFSQAQMQVRLGQLFGRNLNFAFPLSIPAPITSLFGWRIHPISGSPRFHRGIDFGAPFGTPILAAKAGRVETAETMDGYGLAVIVQHGTAYQTLYGHMSQIYVKPGDVVKKGQLLGLVGSTGNSTGPHLHFELHELTSDGWVALDPAIALNGAIALAQTGQIPDAGATKPRTFNLAMGGLLDINPPIQTLSTATFGNTLLASLMPQTSISSAQTSTATSEMILPLTLIPTTIPEFGWLISPWVENLAAELSIPLPGFKPLSQTVSFNPVPALADLPQPVAFDPKTTMPSPANVRLATTKPLAGLTIAEQVPGAVRFPGWQQPPTASVSPIQAPSWQQPAAVSSLSTPPVLTKQQQLALQRLANQQLQLSNKRIKPLEGG